MSRIFDEREYVQSLERGLKVIQVFGRDRPMMNLTEVAKATGMTRASARRFLLTLERLGHVGSDGKMFWLRARVLDLGFSYLSSMPWWHVAQPFMEEVSRETGESCSASVLEGAEVVYVARIAASRILTTNLTIGTRFPAFPSAMGRVLLAELPEDELQSLLAKAKLKKLTRYTITDPKALKKILQDVRRQGYCVNDQELEIGLRAIAVPIRDRTGKVLAAVNVSGHAGQRKVAEMVKNYLPPLKAAAEKITAGLPNWLRH
jgi:IclR family pca regulon transcriptional regulator